MQQDHYSTLGVTRDASHEEIQRAYRRLVLLYHPDVNPGLPDAQEQLHCLNQAYEVLRDAATRDRYDHAMDLFCRGRCDSVRVVTIPKSVLDRRRRDLLPLLFMTIVAVVVLSMGRSLCGADARVPFAFAEGSGEPTHVLATKFLPDQVEGVFGYLFPRGCCEPEQMLCSSVAACSLIEPYSWASVLSSKPESQSIARVSGYFQPLQISQ